VGREKASQLNPDSTHKGFKIMEQIIELYGKLYHTDINQNIEDLVNAKGHPAGTRVVLSISNQQRRASKGLMNKISTKFMHYGE